MRNNFENHRLRTLLWIVKQLEERPMSLKELNSRWVKDVALSGGQDIERRTFFNYTSNPQLLSISQFSLSQAAISHEYSSKYKI